MFLPTDNILTSLVAVLLEAVIGYPGRLYRWIGHPVTWIGRQIAALDARLNRPGETFSTRRWRGVIALFILLSTVTVAALICQVGFLSLFGPFSVLPLGILVSSLMAQRSLHRHVEHVAQGLEQGLTEGRKAVSHIVGRDPQSLDAAGVARAAIESLAENFSDGVVAPAFYTALAGLVGGALYKAVNTADSMIGHRTPRHEAYGWAAARLDDGLNLPASRLAAMLIVLAACCVPECRPGNAWRAIRRDASHHRSPNAGWPESAMAGALGLRLAGPRVYGGVSVLDRWMGDGRADADAGDIRRALRVYRLACLLQAGFLMLLGLSLKAMAR